MLWLTFWMPTACGRSSPAQAIRSSISDGHRGTARFVAEVKSLTESNEEHQLRLGLGQVLRYQHALLDRFHLVHAVLVVEREPGDSAWKRLCRSHDVRLLWPPDFTGLLEDLGPPNRLKCKR